MKKYLNILFATLIIASMLCSCTANNNDNKNDEEIKSNLIFSYDNAYDNFDESVISAYQSICKSIINYDNDVRVNTGMLDDIRQLLYTSFPLIELVSDISKKSDNSGIELKYKFDKEKHNEKVMDFSNKIEDIEKECKKDSVSKTEYVINIYNYVANHIVESDKSSISCYETIMIGEGTSFSYSNMFEYLLLQAEIPASHIIAEDTTGAGWGLSAAAINNQLYYFDPMSEHFANSGRQLVFFAMTSDDVYNEGLKNLKCSNMTESAKATDDTFEPCRSCKAWEIKDNKLLITRPDDKTVEINL